MSGSVGYDFSSQRLPGMKGVPSASFSVMNRREMEQEYNLGLEETPEMCVLEVEPEVLDNQSDLQRSLGKISAMSQGRQQNLTYEEHVDKIMGRIDDNKNDHEINEELMMEF